MYQIEYSEAAIDDMVEIASYISKTLGNPSAAERLAYEITAAAENLAVFPYSKPVYQTPAPLKREYRRLGVKNYTIFYWINELEKQVVIARVLYSRRSFDRLLV